MAVVVVATTLVRDARSKSVVGWTALFPLFAKGARDGAAGSGVADWASKSPPCLRKRRGDEDGAPASYVNRPRAFRATRLPWWVTDSEAAGKDCWSTACCRMAKTGAKSSS